MKYKTIKSLFTAICDAIRNADGTSSQIKHQDIPERINKLIKPADSVWFTPNITTIDIDHNTISLHMFDENEIEEDTPWSVE